jgi:uncharacterized protein
MSRTIPFARLLALCLIVAVRASAQPIVLSRDAAANPARLDADIARIARMLRARPITNDTLRALTDRAVLALAAGQPREAAQEFGAIRARPDASMPRDSPLPVVFAVHAEAARDVAARRMPLASAYAAAFRRVIGGLADRDAFEVAYALETPFVVIDRGLRDAVQRASSADSLSADEATALVRMHVRHRGLRAIGYRLPALLAADVAKRYVVDTAIRIRTRDGATLSALTVRSRSMSGPQTTALTFDIYTDRHTHLDGARHAASHGYVGMVADARGKRLSRDSIRPYETEVGDTHAVLDWIVAQPWSDDRVGMYGASYSGFSAWAATKRPHPALKTIVAYVAVIPGLGLPMENNVFFLANYAWPFYVGNNRTLDNATYGDRARWTALPDRWYASGKPYRAIDQIDGTPNPMLQRWLEHPSYDAYWQRMVPHGDELSKITIPVLSVTGYFDDSQISAIEYVKEHLRRVPSAEHYLVIGPYDHFSTPARRKPSQFNGYTLDAAAQFSGPALTFAWFDHVFRGAPKPSLVRDRINHQVMGSNAWRHAPSFEALSTERLRLHLNAARNGSHYRLTEERPNSGTVERVVDMGDRSTQGNGYYPNAVIRTNADFTQALTFVSEPFDAPVEVSGVMTGTLRVIANKRDFDFNLVLYELMPDGRLFHLTYVLGRASYAADMSQRRLLEPGQITTVPFTRSRMTSRRLSPGSRLMVVFDINKDSFHQVNHGTGRDVSDESAADAGGPLRLQLLPGSAVEVPIRRP